MTVKIREAKTHLSRLLARVEAGERIFIARNGRPIAILAPVDQAVDRAKARRPSYEQIVIHPDFDEPVMEFDPDFSYHVDPLAKSSCLGS